MAGSQNLKTVFSMLLCARIWGFWCVPSHKYGNARINVFRNLRSPRVQTVGMVEKHHVQTRLFGVGSGSQTNSTFGWGEGRTWLGGWSCLGWGRAPKPIKPNNEKKSEPTSQIGPKIPTHLRDERSSMTWSNLCGVSLLTPKWIIFAVLTIKSIEPIGLNTVILIILIVGWFPKIEMCSVPFFYSLGPACCIQNHCLRLYSKLFLSGQIRDFCFIRLVGSVKSI